MKFRKGELTTQQIVMLIVLLASFAVLLFLLLRLNLGQNTEAEVCHNSVVARGSSVVSTDAVPLKCYRQYVCLTFDGSCEKMVKPVKKKVKTEEDVYQVLADEMADCWWMFGEGKVNYVGKDMLPKLYCSICDQVAFDDSVKKIFPEGKFDKKKLYEYFAMANVSGKDVTFAQYFYNTNDLNQVYKNFDKNYFGEVNLDSQYYVLMGIMSDVSKVGWGIGAAAVAGGLILSPLTGGVSLISIVGVLSVAGAGAAGNYFVAPVVEGLSGNDYVLPSLVEVGSQVFDSLKCKDIVTLS